MIASVKNAISIINCFSYEKTELSLAEITDMLGMNKSTVHHLLKTLGNEGLLIKKENRNYTLGMKLFEWGSLVNIRNQIVNLAISHIHELVKQTRETVHTGVFNKGEVVYIAKSLGMSTQKMSTKIGATSPSYCTALGKILLSNEKEENIHEVIEKGLVPRTAKTITNKKMLITELYQIREQGYAVDYCEYENGLYCMATKITDMYGDCIAAISISGPEQRMLGNKRELQKSLTNSALNISKSIRTSIDRFSMNRRKRG